MHSYSRSSARAGLRVLLLLVGLLVSACSNDKYSKQPYELLVGVLDDPIFYQPATEGHAESGFEFDLLQAFAESKHLKLRVVPVADPAKLRDLLRHRSVDFVAGLPYQDDATLLFTRALRETKPLIVQNADSLPIFETGSLADRTIEVLRGTIQAASLAEMQKSVAINIAYPTSVNGLDLLERVSTFRSELAATDSIHLEYAVNYFPDLIVAQELPGKVAYAWAFRPGDEELHAAAAAFVETALNDGTTARVQDRYFGHINRISPIGATQFIEDIRRLLPRFRRFFQEAQTITSIDWRLLAALSYQESKWDPLATSYTNVRGMMMLTEETADRLGVDNRLDPQQAILAGARYLAELKKRLADSVPEPDRQWMAIAAYNLGYGHMNGARQIAPSLSRDPNSWYDMKKVLPLMAKPEYYERLKSGRARGGEAVILTENVRVYYDILSRLETPFTTPLDGRQGLGLRVSAPPM